MAIRVKCMSMLCVGSLIVPMVQASNVVPASAHSSGSHTAALGAIDEDLMHIVEQVMYGKTPGQVIDELVSTYGYGQQSTTALSGIAQLLSEQLSYLSIALESAQAIVAILPPTSPHLVAAKLIINELSVFATCAQTVSAQIQQNAQATAPAAASSAVSATPASTATPALASTALTLLGDVASAIAASSSTNAAAANQATTSSAAPASNSNTHHHGSHTSS